MAYYDTCPECGANLDPGEKCDCHKKESASQRDAIKNQYHDNKKVKNIQ